MGVADLVRLFAIPIYGLIAYRDVKYRRVPPRVWYPLVGLGIVTLAYDGWQLLGASSGVQQLFLARVGFSIVVLGIVSLLFYYFGIIDETIAKAFGLTGLLYPVYPPEGFLGGVMPLEQAVHGVLSLSIVSNAAIVGLFYPIGYALWNALQGQFSPVMFAGRLVHCEELVDRHGRLLETKDGYSLTGLDLDVVKEYLKWRGITIALVRQRPADLRNPNFLIGEEAGTEEFVEDLDGMDFERDASDEWAAEQFLDEVDDEIDVTPEQLRGALNLMAGSKNLWVSANFPFVVPVFAGVLVVYTIGDLPSLL